MIGFLALLLHLQPIITAHNRWLPKTCSIPYWTTSVFSTVIELVLIYEGLLRLLLAKDSVRVWVWVWVLYYDRRSVGQSVLVSNTHLGLTTTFLLLSDRLFIDVERSLRREDGSVVYNCSWPSLAQSFSGPSPYFTVSDSRLPFSSPPRTRRVTVEVFYYASTRDWTELPNELPVITWCGQETEHPFELFICCHLRIRCHGSAWSPNRCPATVYSALLRNGMFTAATVLLAKR
jgi:hypothetical protein